MPRLEPLSLEDTRDLKPLLEATESRMGFLPNSQLILARRPEILRVFVQMVAAIQGPSSTLTPQLRSMSPRWRAVRLVADTAWPMVRTAPSAAASSPTRKMRLPLLVVGAAMQSVQRVPRFTLWVPSIERAGGILLLVAALYFLYQSAGYWGLVPLFNP